MINLALKVLFAAAYRSSSQAVGTVEVRLALRIVYYFTRERRAVDEYWQMGTLEPRRPWTTCHTPYRRIVAKLLEDGWQLDPTNVPN